jgi:hypothetical protein
MKRMYRDAGESLSSPLLSMALSPGTTGRMNQGQGLVEIEAVAKSD